MQLLIIRHADPDYVNDSLTEDGHLEAAALGKKLARFGIDELYASPLGRAQMTARYISESTGLSIQMEEWTRELASWQVLLPNREDQIVAWDYPPEYITETQNDFTEWKKDNDFWLKDPNKKIKYNSLITSSDKFFENHGFRRKGGLYVTEQTTTINKKIAVVCHGGFGLAWLSHLLQLPLAITWSSFWLPPSSVTTILFEKRDTEIVVPRCIQLSDISHLEEAGLPVKSSGLLATNY